jgi:hypothetical protein
MVRVFQVDFDFMAAIGGLVEVEVGALRGAFGDRLVGSVVSVPRDLFPRADLKVVASVFKVWLGNMLESVLKGVFGTVIGGVLGSPSRVDAVCALAVGDMK